MIFIDGGYLTEGFKTIYGHKRINFSGLFACLTRSARGFEIVRAYYYDAMIDPEEDFEEFKKQKDYFSNIQQDERYEVKLARLKGTAKGRRQKGADVKLAVDMITKALMNHYDTAFLLSGDDDFLDLVRAVKDFTDKRVHGFFYQDQVSEELLKSFDRRHYITKKLLDSHKVAKE